MTILKTLLKYGALAVLLVFAIVGIYSLVSTPQNDSSDLAAESGAAQVWTCSMHPQVRKNKHGQCPICGMPLILAGELKSKNVTGSSDAMLTLSDHARAMASVETAVVAPRLLSKEISAVGKIQYNETGLANIVSRVDGYIERLYVDYTGVSVKEGDHLADVYSQELFASMSEMLILGSFSDSDKRSLEASKAKLRQFGVTDAQINEVLRAGKAIPRVTFFSPINGTVVEKLIVSGNHINRGDMLFRVANLDSVWALLDIYESEVSWIQYGREVEITAEAFSGETFKGIVTFISPTLNPETRTIKVRVNLPNPGGRFKPEMFVRATVRIPLLSDGHPASTGLEGKFTCPMHPEIIADTTGKCRICGMALLQLPGKTTDSKVAQPILAVPASAVLDSGRRKLVYVEKSRGEFAPAELVIGPKAGDYYPVLRGLTAGDKVAVRGNFLLDSQFQIKGLPSLFYPQGEAPAGGHQHGAPAPAQAAPPANDPHAAHRVTPAPAPAEHKH